MLRAPSRIAYLRIVLAVIATNSVATAAQLTAAFVPASGNWNLASNWDLNWVPDNNASNTFNALIDLSDVTFDTIATVDILTIGELGSLSIGDSRTLTIPEGANSGSVTVDGLISLNATSGMATLKYVANNGAQVELNGAGVVRMNGYANNRILAEPRGATLRIDGVRIEGGGKISDFQIDNYGEIVANQATALLVAPANDGLGAGPGPLHNHGVIRAEAGGALQLLAIVYADNGEPIDVMDDSMLEIGSVMVGGGIRTHGTGRVEILDILVLDGSDATLGPVTLDCDLELGSDVTSTLFVEGDIYNHGALTIHNEHDLDVIRGISAYSGPATLRGGGEIVMTNHASNFVGGSGYAITNVDNTIHGAGTIGRNTVDFVNQGLIIADQTLPLVLDPKTTLTNSGTLRAQDGGTLTLKDGAFQNTGGTIEALDGSSVQIDAGATLLGGTFHTEGTGVIRTGSAQTTIPNTSPAISIDGVIKVQDGHQFTVNTAIALEGELRVCSSGQITKLSLSPNGTTVANPNIHGGGRIVLSDHAENRIQGSRLFTLDATIEGAGTIGGETSLVIYNRGTIKATGVNPLIVDYLPGGASPTYYNDGIYQASGPGGLVFPPGLMINRGEIVVDAGSSLTRDGEYGQIDGMTSISGTLSASGTFNQDGGETRLFSGAVLHADLVLVDGGLFEGGGTVQSSLVSSGLIAPGDAGIGTLTISGGFTQNAAGALLVELDGASDLLAIDGTADLNGLLRVELPNGFDPPIGSSFQIVSAASCAGTFSSLDLPVLANRSLGVAYHATGVTLHVLASPEHLGDMNCDGDVDLNDAPLFAMALADPDGYWAAQPGCEIQRADMNGDAAINGADVQGFVDVLLAQP